MRRRCPVRATPCALVALLAALAAGCGGGLGNERGLDHRDSDVDRRDSDVDHRGRRRRRRSVVPHPRRPPVHRASNGVDGQRAPRGPGRLLP